MNNTKKIIIGLIAGIISGLFTAGGGLILVPIFINILKMDEKKARGTATFCILPMVITSAIFYYNQKYFKFDLAIKCIVGGIIGGIIGGKLLKKIPTIYIRILFTVFLFYVSIKMIF